MLCLKAETYQEEHKKVLQKLTLRNHINLYFLLQERKTIVCLHLWTWKTSKHTKTPIASKNLKSLKVVDTSFAENKIGKKWRTIYLIGWNNERKTAHNKGFGVIGADGITMSICNSIWLLFGQTSFNLAFCCYLQYKFYNWASVPGWRFSNSPTTPSPVRQTVKKLSFS